jgi:tRNA-Thr(GGU) m(6)t(6)A37 methyltransferase TsaA
MWDTNVHVHPLLLVVATVVSGVGLWQISSSLKKAEALAHKQVLDAKFALLQEQQVHAQQLEEAKQQIQLEKQRTEEQRKGKTNVEREFRNYKNEQAKKRSEGGDAAEGASSSQEGFMPPIGYLESCYRERNGTPRQGLLADGRAMLRLRLPLMDASHTLQGLEQYSHVWVIFIFHENTNILRGLRKDKVSSSVKAKVRPPRLDGVKVGLFSTRTPHRPNPIGLSVARVDRIEGAVIHLSGIDIIDGTPVLDIKPYIPQYDSIPTAITPSWTYDPPVPALKVVVFRQEAEEGLRRLIPQLKFYKTYEEIRNVIEHVLQLDIRSVRRRRQDRQRDSNNKSNNNNNNTNNTPNNSNNNNNPHISYDEK